MQVVNVPGKTGTASVVFKYLTPGSMFNIGVTESTNRGLVIVAGGKSVHANVMVIILY